MRYYIADLHFCHSNLNQRNYLHDPSDFYSHNDEDYPIDWAVGDFS